MRRHIGVDSVAARQLYVAFSCGGLTVAQETVACNVVSPDRRATASRFRRLEALSPISPFSGLTYEYRIRRRPAFG